MGDFLRFLPSFCHLLCFCILFVSFVYGARELADDLSTYKGARALLSSGQGIKLPLKKSRQDYVVTVGFGTPKLDLSLMFDSGSPTTWIKCKPCITCNQNEPIFDPFQSSTFSSCISGNCPANQSYHDKSYSTGITVHDTLTLSNGVSFPNFEFLCSHNNSGFQGFAGLLGLELSDNSFISQTTETFSQTFGYCLPSLESSTGFLAFGDEAVAACSPQFRVPLVAGPNGYDHYYVDLVAITIGEKRLQMPSHDVSSSSSKVILDSGTPISHLPQSVYSELSSSFQELMSEYGPFYSSGSMTCFNLEGHDLSTINIPTITLQFGDSLDLTLGSTSVVLIENSNACLAFIGDDETIIGTHQQRDLNILYDISNKQVGFSLSKGSCSY